MEEKLIKISKKRHSQFLKMLRRRVRKRVDECTSVKVHLLKKDVLIDIYIKEYNTCPYKYFISCIRESLTEHEKNFLGEDILYEGGKVYLIGNLIYGFVKIGYSKNPAERVKELQTGCPFDLTLFSEYKGDRSIEKLLHNKYKEYNTRGEWFLIKGDLKKEIINKTQSI